MQKERSEIVDFFKGTTVFLTGFTGFLGKVYVEKLLRTCEIAKIFVLLRPKKGKDVNSRFDELFDLPIFENLKRTHAGFLSKVVLLPGDCNQPNLGLNESDVKRIIIDTSIVIHCAATVRFDQNLRTAANINVRSVRDLLNIAQQMTNLKGFLHVSTAFSNCVLSEMNERFYKPPMSATKLFQLLEALDDKKLEEITPKLLGKFPNTYVYTKAIAEDVIKMEGRDLPIAVVRPSVIVASVKEPLCGWIDNFYTVTGILSLAGLGILRFFHMDPDTTADIIPVDYCINASLAAIWEASNNKNLIYNIVSSPESKITWQGVRDKSFKYGGKVPLMKQVWPRFFVLISSSLTYNVCTFFLQTIPAHIVDFVLLCKGKTPILVKGYERIYKLLSVLDDVSMEVKFTNQNTQSLWHKMNFRDKKLFEFSMKNFDWDEYWITYCKGIRVYLLKDPLDTLPQARKKLKKLLMIQFVLFGFLIIILSLVFFYLLCKISQ